jgi:hypothetical protein
LTSGDDEPGLVSFFHNFALASWSVVSPSSPAPPISSEFSEGSAGASSPPSSASPLPAFALIVEAAGGAPKAEELVDAAPAPPPKLNEAGAPAEPVEAGTGFENENPENPPLPVLDNAGAAAVEEAPPPKAEEGAPLPPNPPKALPVPLPLPNADVDVLLLPAGAPATLFAEEAGLPNENMGAEGPLVDAEAEGVVDAKDEEEPKLNPVEKGFGLLIGAAVAVAAAAVAGEEAPNENPAGAAFGDVPEPKETAFGGDVVDDAPADVAEPKENPANGLGGIALGVSFFSDAAGSATVSTCRRGEG